MAMVFEKITATTRLSDTGEPVDQESGFVSVARSQAGFSLAELATVIFVLTAILGLAVLGINNSLRGIHANTAVHQVATTLREARQRAMSTNRNHQVTFVGNNQIRVQRWCTGADTAPPPAGDPGCAGAAPGAWNNLPTAVNPSLTLGNQNRFMRDVVGLVSPDGFGNNPAEPAIDFTTPGPFVFTPEGFLVQDDTALNNIANGTIYIGDQIDSNIVRAVTILGSVGRVRTWNWITTSGIWRR